MKKGSRKTRPDSTLDKRLGPRQRDEFYAWAEKHSLEEAEEYLRKKYRVRLSSKSISIWLSKRRADEESVQFRAALARLNSGTRHAEEVMDALGAIGLGNINTSTVAMVGKEAFDAVVSKDPKRMAMVVTWAEALKALAAMTRADAQKQDSETSRDKFEFDAATAARKYANELLKINRSKCSEREKTEQAVVLMFGKRPENLSGVPA